MYDYGRTVKGKLGGDLWTLPPFQDGTTLKRSDTTVLPSANIHASARINPVVYAKRIALRYIEILEGLGDAKVLLKAVPWPWRCRSKHRKRSAHFQPQSKTVSLRKQMTLRVDRHILGSKKKEWVSVARKYGVLEDQRYLTRFIADSCIESAAQNQELA